MDIIYAAHLESNCPRTHFLCANKKCVQGSMLCDQNDDCGDMSDETGYGCAGMEI